MKVVAFIGSGRKGHTYSATELFLKKLQLKGDIEYEIVPLSDYNLQICKGCSLCLNKGEELCPLRDDRDKLLEKIENADGIIFATPNYSFDVSGLMKVFLDRFGFVFHRPRYFGKVFTNIVVQGVYRGDKIVNYLNFIGKALGTNVKGSCLITREPIPEKRQKKNDEILENHSKRFYKQLIKKGLPSPSIFELMIFRLSRNGISKNLNETFKDYIYFKEKGWFESDFYYPVDLSFPKKIVGLMFDHIKM
ncbi:MAG: NADPH-dependent FMN reductase [Bacteroidetes bacterium GWF2_33_16]|nr:MAG: NADPH-dependent FMN reductase [Bacteroidetes bacterium GWE2_32_14]OFY08666.1 MAG: NADPH-dependent FMN reductase [Bacteroidetes bacterium GWF2_33_16]